MVPFKIQMNDSLASCFLQNRGSCDKNVFPAKKDTDNHLLFGFVNKKKESPK
jgi:hypothetical protein